MAAAERHLLEAEYDDYTDSNASGTSFCRSAALVLLALLLLRHALALTDPDADDDVSAFFSLLMLRAAGFLLPCYIMAWALSMLQRRRQRQEAAAALAGGEVAYLLHAGQHGGLQIDHLRFNRAKTKDVYPLYFSGAIKQTNSDNKEEPKKLRISTEEERHSVVVVVVTAAATYPRVEKLVVPKT
ncbi:hypothetical protein Dimus_023969 [Dionaea muscipula]